MPAPAQYRTRVLRPSIAATSAFMALFTLLGVIGIATRSSGPPLSLGQLASLVLVAALLAIPVLVCFLLSAAAWRFLSGRVPRRGVSVGLGILLSLIPSVLGILMFHDSDDPDSLRGYIQFWQRMPAAFVLGFLPYFVSGAVFGLSLARPRHLGPAR